MVCNDNCETDVTSVGPGDSSHGYEDHHQRHSWHHEVLSQCFVWTPTKWFPSSWVGPSICVISRLYFWVSSLKKRTEALKSRILSRRLSQRWPTFRPQLSDMDCCLFLSRNAIRSVVGTIPRCCTTFQSTFETNTSLFDLPSDWAGYHNTWQTDDRRDWESFHSFENEITRHP